MKKIFWKILKIIWMIFLLLILVIGLFLWFIYNKYIKNLQEIEILQENEMNEDYIFYNDIPKNIIKTSIFIEDRYYLNRDFSNFKINTLKRFFSEYNVEWTSTIHHLLIRELLKKDNWDLRWIERILVWNYYSDLLFRKYSKEKILEMYLNKIIFLEDWTKLKNIWEKLFNKKLSELNNFEISIILSLPKSPKWLSPYKNYDKLMWYFYIDWTYNEKTREYKKIDNKKVIEKYFEKFNKENILNNDNSFQVFSNLSIKDWNNFIKYNYWRKWWVLFRMFREWVISSKEFKEIIIKKYKYNFK